MDVGFESEYRIIPAKRAVSLVIAPIDSFTGRIAAGKSLCVAVEGMNKMPVAKQEGYYVFTDIPIVSEVSDHSAVTGSSKPGLIIKIKSSAFFEQQAQIDTACLDRQNPVVKVRLVPSRHYDLPQKASLFTGRFDRFTDLAAISAGKETGIKLISSKEEEGRGYLGLYASYAINPVDKEFALVRPDGTLELFYIEERSQDGLYRLPRPIAGHYARGEPLYPVSRGRTDETGYLFLPLQEAHPESKEFRLYRIAAAEKTEFMQRITIRR